MRFIATVFLCAYVYVIGMVCALEYGSATPILPYDDDPGLVARSIVAATVPLNFTLIEEPFSPLMKGDGDANADAGVADDLPANPVVAVSLSPVDAIAEARSYLVKTAFPGGTMERLGREKSIACLHPDFATRLAAAVKDARASGLPNAGALSACRPPFLKVGGFRDKFNSLHAYGLAVDMHGIGPPGSSKAKLWHKIAANQGVLGVYGPNNRAEWNHMQATRLRIVSHGTALRKTITSQGPISLERMWAVAGAIVVGIRDVIVGSHEVKTVAFIKKKKHRRYVKRFHHRRYAKAS